MPVQGGADQSRFMQASCVSAPPCPRSARFADCPVDCSLWHAAKGERWLFQASLLALFPSPVLTVGAADGSRSLQHKWGRCQERFNSNYNSKAFSRACNKVRGPLARPDRAVRAAAAAAAAERRPLARGAASSERAKGLPVQGPLDPSRCLCLRLSHARGFNGTREYSAAGGLPRRTGGDVGERRTRRPGSCRGTGTGTGPRPCAFGGPA